ncbi:hypothetical protein SNE40_007857 [Patella caerulea]|uniref:Uncharacterized protein n=1 Tax=Patella caerulea TaxID=87958 RepID=A0AAN8JYI7_PATCE
MSSLGINRKEESLRNAVYRLELKGDQKTNYNNKAKVRMRRYRERQKEKRHEKPLTRNEEEKIKKRKEDIREYNKI